MAEHGAERGDGRLARVRGQRARSGHQKGEELNKAVGKLLTKMIKEHKRIIFNGNNYADEWQKEAAKRKLLNHKNTVDALPEMIKPDVIKLLDRFKILNEREVHARYEIFLENYNKTINVEGQLAVLMANRYILPAAFEYQKQIGQSVAAVKAGAAPARPGKKLLATYTKLVDKFKTQTDVLASAAGARQQRVGREAREVHARQDRSGDGQAARDWRRDRSEHAARDSGRCRRIAKCCSSSRSFAVRDVRTARGRGRRLAGLRLSATSQPSALPNDLNKVWSRRRSSWSSVLATAAARLDLASHATGVREADTGSTASRSYRS